MSETGFTGFDLRHNLDAVDGAHGIYSTDYYTESAVKLISDHNIERPLFVYMSYQSVHSANSPYELQAPKQLVDKFSYIKDENRRIFAATLYSMDLSIGRIVNELHNKNILNNTIILFMSDNGGAISGFMENSGSNYPLRGTKGSLWEGSTTNCDLTEDMCLFNIRSDPCEYYNVAKDYPQIVDKLWQKILIHNKTAVPPLNLPIDPKANPIYHNNWWSIWVQD
ncbi:unnamed protein product [Medioppia subpectinata]|uniref:Sulfatase N-terminal domain-containing protein n=1 Tax=Medioppia subpectinata TaxID=1979941 RepID=A0A7R9Q454_9ACAR|nr:unnamed protein product [Medioppia subpectinata]CAG2111167.1 unnamed protein product [Medioppia subpectinata]